MTAWGLAVGALATGVLSCAAALSVVSPPPTPLPPTPAPPPRVLAQDPTLEVGYALFREKGCVNCHGASAEALVIVNLTSITVDAVMKQARNPTGMMPAFSPQAVSDAELEQIARFVVAVLMDAKQGR